MPLLDIIYKNLTRTRTHTHTHTFNPLSLSRHRIGYQEFTANVARPWFLFGDQASFATPGGSVRVVGDAIGLPVDGRVTTASLLLTPPGGGAPIRLSARTAPDGGGVGASPTISHAYFDLPADIAPGM